jgi:RNA polymerase sigma factor (sigma-70 family)
VDFAPPKTSFPNDLEEKVFGFPTGAHLIGEMSSQDDISVLRQYAASHSEAAFETLVSRYVRLVYAAALRQMRDPHLAEEVTQAVFTILADKAGRIRRETHLPGWLVRTTCFVALAHARTATRRRHYETEAFMQSQNQTGSGDELWASIAPMLDEALVQLGNRDRQAVVLRFLEDKSLAEVGGSLGVGEDAARMRVNRALEKLRQFFLKRGVSVTAAILAGTLSANSAPIIPPTLVKTITAAAVAKGAASGSTLVLVKGALKLMAWTKAKTAIVASACVLLGAGTSAIVYEQLRPTNVASDWATLNGTRDQWTWVDNKVIGRSTNGDALLASRKEYRDVTVSAVASTTNREASLAIRMQDADNGYIVVFAPAGTSRDDAGHVSLVKRAVGEETTLGTYRGRVFSSLGATAKVKVIAKGSWLEVLLNDLTVLRVKDTSYSSGFVGLRLYGDETSPCDATFDELKVK